MDSWNVKLFEAKLYIWEEGQDSYYKLEGTILQNVEKQIGDVCAWFK